MGDGGATPPNGSAMGSGWSWHAGRSRMNSRRCSISTASTSPGSCARPKRRSRLSDVGNSPPKAGLPEAELAAYALVANTLLNLDETVTRN